MKKIFLLLLILISFFSYKGMAQYSTEEGNEARTLWLKGFDIFDKAESTEKKNDKKAALASYQESMTYFQKVKAQYPKWNTALVEYRMKICERKIQTLQPDAIPSTVQKTATTSAEPDRYIKQLKEKVNVNEKQLEELQSKLDLSIQSLNEARKEAAVGVKSRDEVQSILREKSEIEKRCAALSDEVKRLQTENEKKIDTAEWTGKLEAERAKAKTLSDENAAIVIKNSEIKVQYQKAASDRMELEYKVKVLSESQKTFNDKLDAASKNISDYSSKAKEYEKRNSALEGNLAELQSKFDKVKQENAGLNKSLKEIAENPASSNLTKQIQADNDRMKKDIESLSSKIGRESLDKIKISEEKKEMAAKLEKVESILIDTKKENKQISAEIDNMRKKVVESGTSTDTYQSNISQLSEENKSLKAEVESLAGNLDKLGKKNKELANIAKELAALEEKYTKLAEEKTAAVKDNEKLKGQLTELDKTKSELDKIKNEKEDNVKKIAELQEDLNSKRADIEAKTKELAKNSDISKKYSDLEKTSADLAGKNAELEKSNANTSKKADDLAKKLTDLNKTSEYLVKTSEDSKKKIEELSTDIVKKNEMLSKKEAEIKSALKAAASDNISDELKKQLKTRSDEYAKLESERDDLKTRISKLNGEIESQKKINDQLKTTKPAIVERKGKEIVRETVKAPNEEEINLLLKEGDNADGKGNRQAAIWHYEKILTMAPENNPALTRLAYIYSDRGDDDKTLKYVERSLCYEPYDVHKLLIAAFAYIRKGEYYLALGVLSRAAAQDPKNPELQRYLGIACSNLGWIESADRQFRTAFELDPKSSETAFNLAVLLATCEPPKMPEARTWYKKAMELGAETDPGMERLFKE
jgi:Flp pilus assembly protein TadD